ncbi:MAG: tRNA pseudouridine(38-40) synthase TruA [Brumimicrobium sp.]|nr:tRNA pseudouridine(38-40) synthase TruA [Brumimicrobium sp.]
MKQRYFFECAYDGTDFSGWQRQPNADTVQETIECMLSRRFNEEVTIVGCGRTDAGVHARQFYFHADLDVDLDARELGYKLNKMLPVSIAVLKVYPVHDSAHARFDAVSRSYKYYIHSNKNPFSDRFSLYFPYRLDLDKMNHAARLLIGEKDFTSFSKLHTDVHTNICDLFNAEWKALENGQLVFGISANRFLRNMVRAIVGTLLQVGQGEMEAEEIVNILKAKDRSAAGVSVPAKGLFLDRVEYPFIPK